MVAWRGVAESEPPAKCSSMDREGHRELRWSSLSCGVVPGGICAWHSPCPHPLGPMLIESWMPSNTLAQKTIASIKNATTASTQQQTVSLCWQCGRGGCRCISTGRSLMDTCGCSCGMMSAQRTGRWCSTLSSGKGCVAQAMLPGFPRPVGWVASSDALASCAGATAPEATVPGTTLSCLHLLSEAIVHSC